MKPGTLAVLELLRAAGPRGITAFDGLAEAHTMRLAGRIHELRAEGFVITSEPETTPRGARVSRYRLHETAQLGLAL